jgi:diacylglycerol kinase
LCTQKHLTHEKVFKSRAICMAGINNLFPGQEWKIQIVFGVTAIILGFAVSLTSFQWLLVLFLG